MGHDLVEHLKGVLLYLGILEHLVAYYSLHLEGSSFDDVLLEVELELKHLVEQVFVFDQHEVVLERYLKVVPEVFDLSREMLVAFHHPS